VLVRRSLQGEGGDRFFWYVVHEVFSRLTIMRMIHLFQFCHTPAVCSITMMNIHNVRVIFLLTFLFVLKSALPLCIYYCWIYTEMMDWVLREIRERRRRAWENLYAEGKEAAARTGESGARER
jgi:hypothetical protein